MDAILDMVLNGSLTEKLVVLIPLLITAATVITTFFPSVGESKAYNLIMKALNWAALNVGHNKNADDPS